MTEMGASPAAEGGGVSKLAAHSALLRDVPPAELELLLDHYPGLARERAHEMGGVLPLHAALLLQRPAGVVRVLLEAYPEGVRVKDEAGMLPLHVAAKQAPVEVVRMLLEAYPEGAREREEHDVLPLHLAVNNQAPLEVLRALLEAYPQGAREKVGRHAPAAHRRDEQGARGGGANAV